MSTVTPTLALDSAQTAAEGRRNVRDSVIVTIGGQLERVLGSLTALALRWGLDPSLLGVYTGLRLYLDQTNRSSLGVGLGAVQEIPILRAAGAEAEAQHIADVAHTTNTLTCAFYIIGIILWASIRAPWLVGDPLANEWTWGLIIVAGLAILKRYESFLVAVLRAHREFALTTELDIVESLVSAVTVSVGLWLAGFWGLLSGIGFLLIFKIVYLHARHPFRFQWAWDLGTAVRLMRIGLPILANTAVFGAILSIDRVLILWRVPDGARAVGLYTIAIMGTSWSLDLAGRIVLVMYTAFQTTLGRTRDPREVTLQAMRATETQAPLLAAGSAIAYLVGPTFLGTLIPRYVEGVPAIRPLILGTFMLGLAWPARQVLITLDHPVRLFLATLTGLGVTVVAGVVGADRAGIVGVAWGMTIGYSVVSLLTSATALVPSLGWPAWFEHQARLHRVLIWYASGALLAAHCKLAMFSAWSHWPLRFLWLTAWITPALLLWGHRHGWGGILTHRIKRLRST